MKKIIICTVVFFSVIVFKQAEGQVINLNINIGSQPVWGPVGYDYVEYYYLPDIEVYYSVPRHQFVYLSGDNWMFSAYLPVRYRSYDLYTGYKIVVNEPRAYIHFKDHKVKYVVYKGNHDKQFIIKNSKEPKYFVVKGHPNYKKQGSGSGKGSKKGKH